MNSLEEVRREDCDTYQEYVRLKNRAKSKREQLSRFAFVLAKIRDYGSDGLSDEEIVRRLANHCEYKLVNGNGSMSNDQND